MNRSVFGWALYDFANSAFATSFMTVIYAVFFASTLVPKEGIHLWGLVIPGESLWGYLISAVMLCVILLSPALGALADQKGLKRAFLMTFALVGAVSTTATLGVAPGRLAYALPITFLAVFGYEMSLVFYNAFLNDLSDETSAGRISGFGFALGYVGGGTCLALNMWMFNRGMSVQSCMLVVGLWWLFFSIPTFLLVRDRADRPLSSDSAWLISLNSLRQLRVTIQSVMARPHLFRFLISFLIFDDGIQTVLLMSSIFGAKALGMTTGELALCFLMIQFVAVVGALVCGRLADAWSHKWVIFSTLVVYSAVICWGVVMTRKWEFWALGAIVGVVMGGSQAAARSLYSLMIPPDKAAEYFSLYSIVGKAAALVGPFVFGLAAQFFGLRAGVASILIFFVIGGAILLTVDDRIRHQSS